jgi:hypothetical protein
MSRPGRCDDTRQPRQFGAAARPAARLFRQHLSAARCWLNGQVLMLMVADQGGGPWKSPCKPSAKPRNASRKPACLPTARPEPCATIAPSFHTGDR